MLKISIGFVLATYAVITEAQQLWQLNLDEHYHSHNISRSINVIILQEFAIRGNTFSIYGKYHPSRKSSYDDIMVDMLSGLSEISVETAVNQNISSIWSSNFVILVDTLQSLRYLVIEKNV